MAAVFPGSEMAFLYDFYARYVSSSSEEDQPSVAKHRSSMPSGANSDQDQPHHDRTPLIIGK